MVRTLAIMQKSRPDPFKMTIVPTMYDKRTNASLQTLTQLKKGYPNQVWSSAIPIDTKFRDASLYPSDLKMLGSARIKWLSDKTPI
jgi:chromosome partitioning protein